MTEGMRTAMKRATALITSFSSFAGVIGPGRLQKSVGRLQGLVSQPLSLCIVPSGPMSARHSNDKAKPYERKLALHYANQDGGLSPLTWNERLVRRVPPNVRSVLQGYS